MKMNQSLLLKKIVYQIKLAMSSVEYSREDKCISKASSINGRSWVMLEIFEEGNYLGRESIKTWKQMIFSKVNSWMGSWIQLNRALSNIAMEMYIADRLKTGFQKVKDLLATKMEVLLKGYLSTDILFKILINDILNIRFKHIRFWILLLLLD